MIKLEVADELCPNYWWDRMTDEVTFIQLETDSTEESFRYYCMPSYEVKKLLKAHLEYVKNYLTKHAVSMSIDGYADYVYAYYRETNGKVDTLILAFQEMTKDWEAELYTKFAEYFWARVSLYRAGG